MHSKIERGGSGCPPLDHVLVVECFRAVYTFSRVPSYPNTLDDGSSVETHNLLSVVVAPIHLPHSAFDFREGMPPRGLNHTTPLPRSSSYVENHALGDGCVPVTQVHYLQIRSSLDSYHRVDRAGFGDLGKLVGGLVEVVGIVVVVDFVEVVLGFVEEAVGSEVVVVVGLEIGDLTVKLFKNGLDCSLELSVSSLSHPDRWRNHRGGTCRLFMSTREEFRRRRAWFPASSATILVASSGSVSSGRIVCTFAWENCKRIGEFDGLVDDFDDY
ncbi:hypothetical protein L1987_43699 [Smallanthus sonchifolius]|uniref:Uncharacterized protein n=1 Tax=Smallanthus sonchifolius TaxID=185202 RepID=A0ACB9GME3_9ASTR|nr:hypothetical protein L1987_43699 [Smallanthus sonchifolius]